ncbi:MAG TPA: hypothetical protein VNJ02_10765 [Vicinamibacterales bacterium]|nr:hypothetical protein [Vicinamibacterales bacterium]
MIEGLKLTMTGLTLKDKLDDRIKTHARRAADYARRLNDPDAADDDLQLPPSVMEGEIEKAHDQIEILTLIRDHIVADEIYRLGEFDLRFADLLPEENWTDCGCFDPPRRRDGSPPPMVLQ